MSEPMQNTDPVDYPKLRVGSSEYSIRISIATLVKLKNQGINLFEQVPYDPQNMRHLAAVNAVRELDKETAGNVAGSEAIAARRAELMAEVLDAESKMTPERRAWKEPLRQGTIIDQWEMCAKILAASVSSDGNPVNYMKLLEEIDPGEINTMVDVLTEAIKKVTAQIFATKT